MFATIAIAILALNAGLVQNCALPKTGCSTTEQEESSYQASSKSLSQSESIYSGSSEYEASQSSSVKEQSTSSYSASSSSSYSESTDVSVFEKAFSECSCLEVDQRDLYLQYLRKMSSSDIIYFQTLVEKLNSKKQFLPKEFQFDLCYNKFHTLYEKLVAEGFYKAKCRWEDKYTILEEYKSSLTDVLSIIEQEDILYGPLKYCLDTNIEYLPMVCGLFEIIFDNQKSYYSSSSSSSSYSSGSTTEVSKTSTRSTSSSSSSSVDISSYKDIMSKCSSINEIERELYYQSLSKMSEEDLSYFSDYFKYLNSKEQFLTEEMFSDFSSFREKIEYVYNSFREQQLYISGCDWLQKKCIFEKIKSELKEILKYIKDQNCFLYKSLYWCLENDMYIQHLPLIIGLDNVIISSQSSYFTSSSTTYETSKTSTRSTSSSSSSSVDISSYKDIMSKCSSINEIERELYYQSLSKMSEEDLSYFSDYFKYLNSKEQFLTEEMFNDFPSFQEKIEYVYNLFIEQQLYISGCDWLQKKCIFEKIKSELKEILKYIKDKNCFLYKSLYWCLENDMYIQHLPLIIGLDNVIISSQSSYFSSSSTTYESSTTQVSKSSSQATGAKTCGC